MAEQSRRDGIPYASLFLASRAFRQAAEEFCAAAEALQAERERAVNDMNRNIRRYRELLEGSIQQEWGVTENTTERGNDPEATGSDLELATPFGSLHQARHHVRIALRNEVEEENSIFNELMRSFEARFERSRRQEEAITGSTAERQDGESSGSNPTSTDFRNGIQQQEAMTTPALQDIEEEGSDISEHTRILRQTLVNASNLADHLFIGDFLDEDLPLPSREAFFATGLLSLNASSSRPTEVCPICIEDIDVSTAEAREAAVVVVRCGHMYHRECVMRWFNELHPDAFFGTDPLCRQRLFVVRGPGDGDWYNEEGDDVFTEDGDDDDDDDGYRDAGYDNEENIYDRYEDEDLPLSHLGLIDVGPAAEPSLTPAPYGTQANIRNDISRLVHRRGERSRLEQMHRLRVENERRFIARNQDAIAGIETVEWNDMSGTTMRIRRSAMASMQEGEDGIRRINEEIGELTGRIHFQMIESATR